MQFDEFLVKANRSAYASGSEGKVLDDGSMEFVYEEGEFRFRDRYFGFNPFAGETVVWKDGEVIWILNYYGWSKSGEVTDEQIFEFLRKAMMLVKGDRPFRGPSEFKEGHFRYTDRSEGDINLFQGIEKIYYKGWEVHHVRYHGGAVKGKI